MTSLILALGLVFMYLLFLKNSGMGAFTESSPCRWPSLESRTYLCCSALFNTSETMGAMLNSVLFTRCCSCGTSFHSFNRTPAYVLNTVYESILLVYIDNLILFDYYIIDYFFHPVILFPFYSLLHHTHFLYFSLLLSHKIVWL